MSLELPDGAPSPYEVCVCGCAARVHEALDSEPALTAKDELAWVEVWGRCMSPGCECGWYIQTAEAGSSWTDGEGEAGG